MTLGIQCTTRECPDKGKVYHGFGIRAEDVIYTSDYWDLLHDEDEDMCPCCGRLGQLVDQYGRPIDDIEN